MVRRTYHPLHILGALLTGALSSALLIALLTRAPCDAAYTCAIASDYTHPTSNFLGSFGAWIADLATYWLGDLAYGLVILLGLLSCLYLQVPGIKTRLIGVLAVIAGLITLRAQIGIDFANPYAPGGQLGQLLRSWLMLPGEPILVTLVGYAGAFIGLILSIQFAFPLRLTHGAARVARALLARLSHYMHPQNTRQQGHNQTPLPGATQIKSTPEPENIFTDPFWAKQAPPLAPENTRHTPAERAPTDSHSPESLTGQQTGYHIPTQTLFCAEPAPNQTAVMTEQTEKKRLLEEALTRFGISGKVTGMHCGPVVTLFEYVPAPDVKISQIIPLEDDLARILSAMSIRIIAPIPGTCTIGFEVANTTRALVLAADIMQSSAWKNTHAALPLLLGKDTSGENTIVDLADMPHLLVAGSTGSGKSVALTTMITGLLCACPPEKLKLVLIDPKRLDLSAFAGIPHLLFPIVTDLDKIPRILHWLVTHMLERYELLAEAQVNNIRDYHERFGHEKLPFITVIIDELADIMVTIGKEVETSIARIAQMARAAGIHLIVATQRPSVDVITGLIKVNFPARIAFRVTSKIDAKTILDTSGAERLLGKGDMLFLSPRGGITRVHGAYLRSTQVSQVVDVAKMYGEPIYQTLPTVATELIDNDPLYDEARAFTQQNTEISISLLQRRFGIGFNRSAKIVEILEQQGVIVPAAGSKMRKVVK
jgi:S-DNA-T family DNA segregation ATPase FtsK/SpoIIIE